MKLISAKEEPNLACDECSQPVNAVIQLGGVKDGDWPVWVCQACLEKAATALGSVIAEVLGQDLSAPEKKK